MAERYGSRFRVPVGWIASSLLVLSAWAPGRAAERAKPAAEAKPAVQATQAQIEQMRKELEDVKGHLDRSHARLQEIKNEKPADPGMPKLQIRRGAEGSGQIAIVQTNAMGKHFVPVRYLYTVDGQRVFDSSAKDLRERKHIDVFRGTITPGDHVLELEMVTEPTSHKFFSYGNQYRLVAKAQYAFTTLDSKRINIKVRSFERTSAGDKTTPALSIDDSLADLPPASPAPSAENTN